MSRILDQKMRDLLKVYFIMGSNNCEKNPVEVVTEAINGGVTLFQFREKGIGALTGDEKLEFAKQVQHICREHKIPFIVNDDVELAVALNADGIHIGQDDQSAKLVRSIIGDDKILGVSVHSLEEARKAITDGADYVGIGPIFQTATKEDAKEVQGTMLIQSLKKNNLTIPIVGIGGITPTNAHIVMEAGADGISVITAISMASSALDSAKKLADNVFNSVK